MPAAGGNNADPMSARAVNVLHVVAADVPPGRLRVLRALLAADFSAGRVVVIGPRNRELPRPDVHLPRTALSSYQLRKLLAAEALRAAAPDMVHAWSPQAARTTAGALAGLHGAASRPVPPWIWEVGLEERPERLLAALGEKGAAIGGEVVCSNETAQRRALAAGVPSDHCHLIRDCADYAAIRAADRTALRRRLGLADGHQALVVLPPIDRRAGSLSAVWAALVALQVRRDLRIVVPTEGPESERIVRLAESCHEREALVVAARFDVYELLAVGDLALYMPAEPAPLLGVVAALTVGVPIVATATITNTELLRHDTSAWLVKPGQIDQAAARILTALEDPAASRRRADCGRLMAFGELAQQRTLDRYRDLYRRMVPRTVSA